MHNPPLPLEQVLNAISEYAIFHLSEEGSILFANTGAERIFSSTVLSGKLWEFCPLQTEEPAESEWETLKESAELGSAENYGIRLKPDQQKIWAHTVYAPILENGKLTGYSVVIRDLSEKRLAEGKYKGLVDSAPDALILIDAAGRINLINDMTEQLFGYRKSDLLGKSAAVLIGDTDPVEVMRSTISGLQSSSGAITLQTTLRHRSGREFPAEISLKKVATGAGEFISCSARDITSRVELDQSLEQANQNVRLLDKWLQGIIDGSRNLIAGLDTQKRFVAFNQAYFSHFKTTHGLHIKPGDSATELLNRLPASYVFLMDQWDRALTGEEFDVEHHTTIKGKLKAYRLSFSAVRNAEGEVIGAAHVVYDITEQHENQLLITHSLREAQEAARMKQEFLANMSHEIRTPMNAIMGFTRLLLKSGEINGENKDYLTTISRSTEDLLVIVNDILDFSKLEAGKLSIERVHFNLKDKLGELSRLFNYKVLEKGIQFKLNIDAAIPPVIVSDPVRITQMITNLMSNAIKFTAAGEVTLSVKLVQQTSSICILRFSVADTGMGIAQNKLDMIFKSFQQAEGHISRKFGGTGLGLAIVKNLVELLEGTISVESELNKGSTFTIMLSFEIGDENKIEKDYDMIPEPHHIFPIRVLMAEDNRNNQVLGRKVLTDFGCIVDIAANGVEALEKLISNYYDIVLMDIQMPEMDGVTAVKAIRKLHSEKSKIPVIAVTAHAMPEEQLRYLEEGMNACITKPFNPKELYMTMVALVKLDARVPNSRNDESES
ncbi:MAG: PAS domain S-box protein [Bacteroidota bacterium]